MFHATKGLVCRCFTTRAKVCIEKAFSYNRETVNKEMPYIKLFTHRGERNNKKNNSTLTVIEYNYCWEKRNTDNLIHMFNFRKILIC